MIGLTWGDAVLTLTPGQWAAIAGNCAAWLAQWRCRLDRRVVALLTCALLFGAFWNVPLGRDTQMLFAAGRQIYEMRLSFSDFIDIAHKYAYIEYQTPWYPFLVSRTPWVWAHQLLLLPWTLAAIWMLFSLFGDKAALLCATPLFALLAQQPSTDVWLFFTLIVSLRLAQTGHKISGAFVYGLSWLVKPLTILTLPFMIPLFGWWSGLAVGIWAGYTIFSIWLMQGLSQFLFILHQLLIRQKIGHGAPSTTWQIGALRWRWVTIGLKALPALPFYLFPIYLYRWRWIAYAVLIIILGGYGNIKYQAIVLLCAFPIIKEV